MKKKPYICIRCCETYLLTKTQAKHTTCKCGGVLRKKVFHDLFYRGESSYVDFTIVRSDEQ